MTHYEYIGHCDICGKPVTSAQARDLWRDEEGTFHCAHIDCQKNPHLKEWRP